MGSIQSHQTSNPNSIAQKATIEALNGPQDTVEVMRKEFDRRRKYMYERIQSIPMISTVEPLGAFYVFVDMSELFGKKYKEELLTDIGQIAKILLEDYNVAVIPCADFGFHDHIRLSYAIKIETIDKGLTRIEKFLDELN